MTQAIKARALQLLRGDPLGDDSWVRRNKIQAAIYRAHDELWRSQLTGGMTLKQQLKVRKRLHFTKACAAKLTAELNRRLR
jgi:hypothetical protein